MRERAAGDKGTGGPGPDSAGHNKHFSFPNDTQTLGHFKKGNYTIRARYKATTQSVGEKKKKINK